MKALLIDENFTHMKPKTEDELRSGGKKDFIYRVWSGVDAFEISYKDMIYLPYIDIIASNKEEAREKVAKMLGQKLEDQDTNDAYHNYVSKEVDYLGVF